MESIKVLSRQGAFNLGNINGQLIFLHDNAHLLASPNFKIDECTIMLLDWLLEIMLECDIGWMKDETDQEIDI